jgi:hypothetical protein
MINSKKALTFTSKKKIKVNKTNNEVQLKLDYASMDKRDIYVFYLTNKTTKNNIMGFPDVACFVNVVPNFIALVSEPGLYNVTTNPCVVWFKDDSIFDTIDVHIIYNTLLRRNRGVING